MKLTQIMVLCGLLVTGGCGTNVNPQTAGWIGASGGMLLGGWAGSQLGAGTGQLIYAGVGAVTGGAAGYDAGRSLAMADQSVYQGAIFGALSTPERQITWQNAETGTSGFVIADRAFRDAAGGDCQTYRATVALADEVVSGGGAACLNNQGNWILVADAFQ